MWICRTPMNSSLWFGLQINIDRKNDNAVLNKANATTNAEIKIKSLEWYVPHYTPSLGEYNKFMTQNKQKTPTNLLYPEGFFK